ncbi:PH domain-containing protein [Anaerocolumna xylanovorans]|uniref:PH domain-containing protein n=1 Tax=Anaerocolumna xylanovorans DSM 12503 TaxID=1121345 RepID=A0A1M7YFI9_9FIRM|nr:PH domain-containing protein [Anaerocolumna xylanovorans]SHO51351.1 PH domain-containing protein [Anaerocolumna xylanovorans DSM 12503]
MTYTEKKRTKLFGLPLTFTSYTISDEKITITSGFLNITVDDAYMYKVQDVKLTKSFWERVYGLGSLTCYTGDTTHPELRIVHIKKATEIKEFLLTASEEARRKRRALHTMEI